MGNFTQDNHPMLIRTPLEDNVLLIDRFEAEESMSALFEFRLRLRSQADPVHPAQIIGHPITVSIDRTDGSGERRYFNGICTRFENHGRIDGDFILYTAILRPWLWLLTQTTDCKIFQHKTALEIAKKLFDDAGGTHPVEILASAPPAREYCVQYNETDFAFFSRLMEDEGIFYYFRHTNGHHTLVIGDDASALAECEESTVSFKSNRSGFRGDDRLLAWAHNYEFRPGKWTHTDYNFETPDADMVTQDSLGDMPEQSNFEIFEFPGDHPEPATGSKRATVRIAQTIFEQDCVRGQSVDETFSAGHKFSVAEHHLESEQSDFLLTMVHHDIDQSGSFADARETDEDRPVYMNWFTAVPAETKIHIARRTVRPRIWGPQTAKVVGPKGEEIYTDKYGRIKIQFHWDRYGKNDENSSCFARVMHLAAGATYGMIAVPRIGHEVIVEFIDGDPDRPLVTGAVYNANNMPPVSAAGKDKTPKDAVAAKMHFTLRSNSLGHSGGYNEITMNDTGGDETLFIKAQHDEHHTVGHDRHDKVGNDETNTVGHDRTDVVDHDEKRTVKNDRTDVVENDEKRTVKNDRTDTVENDEKRTVKNDQTNSVQNDRKSTISNNDSLTVDSDHTVQVGGDQKNTVQGDRTNSVSGDDKLSVMGDRSVSIMGDGTVSITGNATESAMQISITGETQLTLQCGASSIMMTPASITINAPIVMIN